MPVKFLYGKYFVIAGFTVLLLYNFHRYIFQYNFEGTSPTYTNTPTIWKIGKYLIMLLILSFFYLNASYKWRLNKSFFYIYGLVLFIITINILNVIIYGDVNIDELQYCFWFFLTLPYWFVKEKLVDFNINFTRMITIGAWVLLISNVIAIGNYYITGRLPALGYEGGLVRFGGFWDDPNAFGIICVFLFYYFASQGKILLSLFTVISILFTFSFTAYLVLIVSMAYWVLSSYKTINVKWFFASIVLFALILSVAIINLEKLTELYAVKESSVNEHLNTSLIFNIIPLVNSPLQFSENWYKSSFNNYFPVSLLIDAGLLLLLVSLFTNSAHRELKFYFFLFIVCSFFFSLLYVFPLNFAFIFLLADHLKASHFKIKSISGNYQGVSDTESSKR
jgi:hypothetical protein